MASSSNDINKDQNTGSKNMQSNSGNQGFASMDPERQREIASQGGKAAHAAGTAHEFTSEEAREAGRHSHDRDGQGNSGGSQSRSSASGSGSSGSSSSGSSNRSSNNERGGTSDQHSEAGRAIHKKDPDR